MTETELWLVDLEQAAAAIEALEATTPRLSDDLILRLAAMSDEPSRRERRLAHIALRIALERKLGPSVRRIPFASTPSGKPSLADSKMDFSLAHTKGLALIAISERTPIGVDIERPREVRMPDARRGPIEAEAIALAAGKPLNGSGTDARFLSAWARIEAVAKARGSGVGPLLERLRPGGGRPQGDAPKAACDLVAHDLPAGNDIFAAVALPVGVVPPTLGLLPETVQAIARLLEADHGSR
ncbi:MAG TPA: hypothetical protein VEA77_07200 [Hyphomicrobium sp.]|nr:hypothetical protein [Hyphomicrobium sp.]